MSLPLQLTLKLEANLSKLYHICYSQDEDIAAIKQILQNFESKASDFNLTSREVEKRKNAYKVNVDERDKLRRMYDSSLARRIPNSTAAKAADDMDKVVYF
jgi:hypothetical protein